MTVDVTKYIEKDIDLIQKFMNENIGEGQKMTSADIYDALKDKIVSDVPESSFKSAISACVKAGKIKGFEGKRKIGYVRIGTVFGSKENKTREEIEAEDKPRFGIQVTKNIRVIIADKHNVARQHFNSSTGWVNKAYHSDLSGCLKNTVKYMVRENLNANEEIVSLKEAITRIEQVEAHLMGILSEKEPDEIGGVQEEQSA